VLRFIIGILVTVGLIVLIVVLIVTGGNNGPAKPGLNLTNYGANPNSEAELTIDGPEISQEEHRQVHISVTENAVTLTIYKGYQQDVLRSKTYNNNQAAYAVFLHALQHANFTKGNGDPNAADERGSCPSSDRYIMSFSNGSQQLMRYWYDGCGGGTFGGNLGTTLYLFRGQVPDYSKLVNGTNIY